MASPPEAGGSGRGGGGRALYGVLGVPADATQEQIKRAYRSLALQSHPDRQRPGDGQAAEEGNTAFARLALAYEVLGDVQRRKRYDLTGELPESDVAVGRRAGETLLAAYMAGAPAAARTVTQADMSLHSLENYEVMDVHGKGVPSYMRDIVVIGLGYLGSVVEGMEEKEVVLLRHYVMDQMYALLAYTPPLDEDAFKERGYIITYYDHPLQAGIRPAWSDQNRLDKKGGPAGKSAELREIDAATSERRRLAALEWHGMPTQPTWPAEAVEVPGSGRGPERLQLAVRALLKMEPDLMSYDVHRLRRRLEGVMQLPVHTLNDVGGTALMGHIFEAMEEAEADADEAKEVRQDAAAAAPAGGAKAAPLAAEAGFSVRVVSTGRIGEVLLHDPSDPDLTYKVRFDDGMEPVTDWYAASAVVCS